MIPIDPRYDEDVNRTRTFVIPYVMSLIFVIALLVMWIVFALESGGRLRDFAGRLGVVSPRSPWIILGVGCLLFGLVIAAITYQLAKSLAEVRYARKQEEFVSGITHEMRSPLAAIRLHAETLLHDVQTAEGRQSIGFILGEAERLGRLIDNVLESSRLVAQTTPGELDDIVVPAFCESYFTEVRPRVEGAGLKLKTAVDTSATIRATTDGLRRVLGNLIENAIRYSDRTGTVECRVFERGPRVVFKVTDEGIGIPKSDLGLIFDRFYRIGRDSRGEHGTGLGLFIVSQLVEQMHGSVRAMSRETEPGTIFEVEIPTAEGGAG